MGLRILGLRHETVKRSLAWSFHAIRDFARLLIYSKVAGTRAAQMKRARLIFRSSCRKGGQTSHSTAKIGLLTSGKEIACKKWRSPTCTSKLGPTRTRPWRATACADQIEGWKNHGRGQPGIGCDVQTKRPMESRVFALFPRAKKITRYKSIAPPESPFHSNQIHLQQKH